MSDLRDWLLGLPGRGQYTFTTREARGRQPTVSAASTTAALARAETAGLIVTPVGGFHVVVPLEDRGIGTPSWRIFLDPMMTYLGLAYYVGLLTAATHPWCLPAGGTGRAGGPATPAPANRGWPKPARVRREPRHGEGACRARQRTVGPVPHRDGLSSPPSISSATGPARAGGGMSSPSCVTSPRRSARVTSGLSWRQNRRGPISRASAICSSGLALPTLRPRSTGGSRPARSAGCRSCRGPTGPASAIRAGGS